MFLQKPQSGTRHVAWHIAQEGLAAPGMVIVPWPNLMRSVVCYGSPKSGHWKILFTMSGVLSEYEKSENRDEVTVKMRLMDQISGDEQRAHK